jgi:hypothetical protein
MNAVTWNKVILCQQLDLTSQGGLGVIKIVSEEK